MNEKTKYRLMKICFSLLLKNTLIMIKITRTTKERKCNHEKHYEEKFDYNMQIVSFFGFS